MHQDSLAQCSISSTIPPVDATIEHTESINNFPSIAEEGNATTIEEPSNNVDDEDAPDILHPDDDSSISSSESESHDSEGFDDKEKLALETEFEPNNILVPRPTGFSEGTRIQRGGLHQMLLCQRIHGQIKALRLNYIDYMLCYGTDMMKIQEFEEQLGKHFDLKLLRQPTGTLGLIAINWPISISNWIRVTTAYQLSRNTWIPPDVQRITGDMTHHWH